MGALSGNQFQIVIRDIQCNTDQRLVNKSDITPASSDSLESGILTRYKGFLSVFCSDGENLPQLTKLVEVCNGRLMQMVNNYRYLH